MICIGMALTIPNPSPNIKMARIRASLMGILARSDRSVGAVLSGRKKNTKRLMEIATAAIEKKGAVRPSNDVAAPNAGPNMAPKPKAAEKLAIPAVRAAASVRSAM